MHIVLVLYLKLTCLVRYTLFYNKGLTFLFKKIVKKILYDIFIDSRVFCI